MLAMGLINEMKEIGEVGRYGLANSKEARFAGTLFRSVIVLAARLNRVFVLIIHDKAV